MVEVKEVYQDESLEKLNFKYHPRVLEIKAGSTIKTPARVIVDTEYGRKTRFSNDLKLDDFISLVVSEFDEEKLDSFVNKNGALKNLADRVEAFGKLATDSNIKILALKLPKYTNVFKNEKDIETFFRFLDNAQSNINTRSLPYFNSSAIDTSKLYDDFCRNFADPVIWLDLKEDSSAFKKRLSLLSKLVEDKRLQMIGLHHEEWLKANVNYNNLYSEFHDKAVLLLLEGVKRRYSTSLSAVHFYPYVCFDAISPYRRTTTGGGPRVKEPEHAKSILYSQFLYKNQLIVNGLRKLDESTTSSIFENYKRLPIKNALEIAEQVQDEHKKLHMQGKKKEKEITDKDYSIDSELLKKSDPIIKNFSYVQQALEGQTEMEKLSKKIEAHESDIYMDTKEKLKNKVKRFISGKFSQI